jgi:hypothetical protein
MNYNVITLIPLLLFCDTYTETEDHNSYKKNTSTLLNTERTNTLNSYFKKLECPKAKTAIAATTISIGTYLLYDTIQTTIDLQGLPQQNSEKGLVLNAVIAAGLIAAGSYLLKQVLDENKSE